MTDELSHVDPAGRVRMVDVGAKAVTGRSARAVAEVVCSEEARRLLREGRLPKGDGLAVARVAGILAAKRTSELIPLCHPLTLDAVAVDLRVEEVVRIEATVATTGRTGAEMEALTAAAVAGLTVIDLIKAIDRRAALRQVRVVAKAGGASGAWSAGERAVPFPAAGVVTVSDRTFAGTSPDRSGPVVAAALARLGAPVASRLVPDEVEAIREAVEELIAVGCRVIVTTGGTGLGPRDVTPEAVAPLFQRTVPGLAEALRALGTQQTAHAALSRTVAGVIERGERRVVVVALPGSPAAAADSMAFLTPLLPHLIDQLDGGDHAGPGPAAPDTSASGGDAADESVVLAAVGPAVIDPAEVAALVRRAAAGAVVTFTGVVRERDGEGTVTRLDYEAHPEAGRVLAQLLGRLADEQPAIEAVAACHRTGALRPGDVAFVAAVSAVHRREAFLACADVVDLVKAELPVWKRQHFSDGSVQWVNS